MQPILIILMASGMPFSGPVFSDDPLFTFARSDSLGKTTIEITAWLWSIPFSRGPTRERRCGISCQACGQRVEQPAVARRRGSELHVRSERLRLVP
ncbi:MAG: hypothetical protein R3B06_12470 [Kofleriaceae bacterium]